MQAVCACERGVQIELNVEAVCVLISPSSVSWPVLSRTTLGIGNKFDMRGLHRCLLRRLQDSYGLLYVTAKLHHVVSRLITDE
jgi:hypothetical protein